MAEGNPLLLDIDQKQGCWFHVSRDFIRRSLSIIRGMG